MDDPIGAFEKIRDNFILYLKTAFGTQFPGLEREREAMLRRPGILNQQPWIEPLPRYQTDRQLADLGPDIPYQFFHTISQAIDIPIIVFQNPKFRGYSYTSETLAKLAEIENIVAVKLSTWDIKKYEQDIWALKRAKRRVSILPSNDTLLFASFMHGADGALIGLANLVPHWAVELFEATQQGNIAKAREINDRFFPLVELLYETPGLNIYGAMKEALFMMGVLTKPSVSRPPLPPLTANERDAIRAALKQSGLLRFYQNI